MRDIPLEVILEWPTPNYKDPPTRGNALVIINAVLISVVFIVVNLRLYTRIFIKKWFGIDDFFIIPSLVATVGLCLVVILANKRWGWDRHVWDTPLNLFVPSLKVAYVAKLMFVFSATFTRCSLLCFYYRLSRDAAMGWFRWSCHLTMLLNAVVCIFFVLLATFGCIPVEAYWLVLNPANAKCLDDGKATFAAGIVSCFLDFLVTILPIPVVYALQMPLRRRIGVILLLSTGLIVTIAGIIRTYYIWRALMNSYDEPWEAYPLWICAAVEIDLGVLCACAPALRPLISKTAHAISEVLSSSKSNINRALRSPFSSGSVPKRSELKRSTTSPGSSGKHSEQSWPVDIRMTDGLEFRMLETSDSRETRNHSAACPSGRRVRPMDSLEILLRSDQALSGHEDDYGLIAPSRNVTAQPLPAYLPARNVE